MGNLNAGPSLHSINSLRTAHSYHAGVINPNYGANVTPESQQMAAQSSLHGMLEKAIDNMHSNKPPSFSPSLPSISDDHDGLPTLGQNADKSSNPNLPATLLNDSATKSRTQSPTHLTLRKLMSNGSIGRGLSGESIKSINNINPSDLVQKRVLFVSLVQLHRGYSNGIPSFILEHSICVFGVKRSWLFPQNDQQRQESNNSYIAHFKNQWSAEFMDMIANKDTFSLYIFYILHVILVVSDISLFLKYCTFLFFLCFVFWIDSIPSNISQIFRL